MTGRPTRTLVRNTTACPHCHAERGQPCWRLRGGERLSLHSERYDLFNLKSELESFARQRAIPT